MSTNTPNINEAFERPPGGYGRIFQSMYAGSMLGAGMAVFAVWPYVIANMRCHPQHGAIVELNPKLLAILIGECTEADMEEAIGKLCAEDKESRNKAEGGRRLVRMGQFLYRVVNGGDYIRIRSIENRRKLNREAQDRFRARKKYGDEKTADAIVAAGKLLKRVGRKGGEGPMARERAFVEAERAGDLRQADAIVGAGLPADPAARAIREKVFGAIRSADREDAVEVQAEKFPEV